MTSQSQAAVAETPVESAPPKKKPGERKPKPLPPHAVVVLNDDLHSFDYVVEVFQKVFGYSTEKAYTLALDIHTNGRGIVWSGNKEVAELKCEQIRSAGPDIYASKKVDFPLGAYVEPLP